MNPYYLTLILKPELEEKARKDILETVSKKFAKVEKEDLWGARDLAYPIKHNKKGWYAHYHFEAEPKVIAGLDRELKMNEDIIRYLLIKG